MKIVVKQPKDLTTRERKTLSALTIHSTTGECLRYAIYKCKNKKQHKVFIAYEDDKILGWAMYEGPSGKGGERILSYKNPYKDATIVINVSKRCRGRGIGYKIMERVMKQIRKEKLIPRVYMWTIQAAQFYLKCGFKLTHNVSCQKMKILKNKA
jgi:GNAT superfamily N-acetyltransferase